MKKALLFLLLIMSIGGLMAQNSLFISEITDPLTANGRFAEIYNGSGASIDFGTETWYLCKQTNGGSTWLDVQLTGTLAADGIFVVGQSTFESVYAVAPDMIASWTNNGDDGFFLYKDGNHTTGTLVDAYGVLDEDGTGKAWEYTDGRGYRNPGYKAGKPEWTASEWTVILKGADFGDCDPFVHKADPDPVPDNHVTDLAVAVETFSRVHLSWTDAIGTNVPSGYLVKAGESGGVIDNPVDGVVEEDGMFVKNIKSGTGSAIFSSLKDKQAYDIMVFPYSNSGDFIDYKIDGTIPTVTGTTKSADTIVLFEDFELEAAGWITVSDSGDNQEWGKGMIGADGTLLSAYLSGFNYDFEVNEDWLFSPAVNMEAWSDEVLTFYTNYKYGINSDVEYLKLFYSTDYSGAEGTHLDANWVEISFDTAVAAETWFLTTDIDLSAINSPNVYFAFKYRSTVRTDTRSWWVDEFMIKGTFTGETTPPDWKTGYPKTDDVREEQFDVVANINEPGLVYFLITADGADAPSIMDVKMGDTLEVMYAGQDVSTTIDTVKANTMYKVYFIAEDALGNLQDTTLLVPVKTLDPRELALTSPAGGETFFVGDSIDVEWTYLNVDSVNVYVWGYGEDTWYDVAETKIPAALGTFKLGIPLSAGLDSTYMKITDARDETFFDTSGIFYLTDTIVPVLDNIFPANKAMGVKTSTSLVMYFNENVGAGTGYVVIMEEGGASYDSIDVSSVQVTFSEYVAIKPSMDLKIGTKYSVLVDSGAFVDYQDNAWEGIGSDTIWSFTTLSPVEVANLTELRAGAQDGTVYKLTGEVLLTAQMSFMNKKFIQDADAGILIFDPAGVIKTKYNVGDGIKNLIGTIEEYTGMTELVPIADPGDASSTGNTLTPLSVSISDLNTKFNDYESRLISITDAVAFADAGGTFGNGKNYNISNSSGTTVLRTEFYDIDLKGTSIPALAMVVGIAIEYNGASELAPRQLADVVPYGVSVEPVNTYMDIRVYPNPNSGNFTFEWKGESGDLDVEIISMNGKMVYRNAFKSVTEVSEQIDLRNVSRGLYILRVRSADEISISKLIIR